jgi:hypothetical protein
MVTVIVWPMVSKAQVAVDPVMVAGAEDAVPAAHVAGLIGVPPPKVATVAEAVTLEHPLAFVQVKTAVCAMPRALKTGDSAGSTNTVPAGITPFGKASLSTTWEHATVNVVPLVTATTVTVTPLGSTVSTSPAARPAVDATVTVVSPTSVVHAGAEGAVLTYSTPTLPTPLMLSVAAL